MGQTKIEEGLHDDCSSSDDDVICVCFEITKRQVRKYLTENASASVDDFVQATGYGTKCTACLLDLDVIVNDLGAVGLKNAPPGIGSGNVLKKAQGFGVVDRVDSGFFMNSDGITSLLRVANFNPLFENVDFVTPHDLNLWLFTEDGKMVARANGHVGINETFEIDLSAIEGAPKAGWFLLSSLPHGGGYYGTLRPQVVLRGDNWASAYHTQFHGYATNSVRRMAVGIRASAGKSNSSICVINGENKAGDAALRIYGENYDESHKFHLAKNGSRMLDIDDLFQNLPQNAGLIAHIDSDTVTRKFIINRQPDGSWGADHFATFA